MSSPTLTVNAARAPALSTLLLLCLAATWLIWGSTYLAIKFALWSFPPFFQMGTRFLAAGALLMAWMRWRGAAWPTRTQWRNALIIGTLMLGGGMGNTAFAEQTIASGLVVAFIAVTPLLLVLFNAAFGIYPRRADLLAVGVGLIGVLMLTRGSGIHASPIGLAAIAAAATCWSLGSVLSQRGFALAPGATGFASEMLCGGLVLLGVSAAVGESWSLPVALGPWISWLYLVTAGSLLAFNAYMVLLARTSTSIASSYTLVNPLVALLLGVTLGHETVTPWEWSSVGVVMLGVALLFASRR